MCDCTVILIWLFYDSDLCFLSKSLLNVKFFVVGLFSFSCFSSALPPAPLPHLAKMFCCKNFSTSSRDIENLEQVVTELIKVLLPIHPCHKAVWPTFWRLGSVGSAVRRQQESYSRTIRHHHLPWEKRKLGLIFSILLLRSITWLNSETLGLWLIFLDRQIMDNFHIMSKLKEPCKSTNPNRTSRALREKANCPWAHS